jgi:hypothetical protein
MSIWLRGDVSKHLNDKPNMPEKTDDEVKTKSMAINQLMYYVLKSYAKKEPDNVLAHAVLGIYSGNFDHAIDLCLNETLLERHHCNIDNRGCELAVLVFACDLILRSF